MTPKSISYIWGYWTTHNQGNGVKLPTETLVVCILINSNEMFIYHSENDCEEMFNNLTGKPKHTESGGPPVVKLLPGNSSNMFPYQFHVSNVQLEKSRAYSHITTQKQKTHQKRVNETNTH